MITYTREEIRGLLCNYQRIVLGVRGRRPEASLASRHRHNDDAPWAAMARQKADLEWALLKATGGQLDLLFVLFMTLSLAPAHSSWVHYRSETWNSKVADWWDMPASAITAIVDHTIDRMMVILNGSDQRSLDKIISE